MEEEEGEARAEGEEGEACAEGEEGQAGARRGEGWVATCRDKWGSETYKGRSETQISVRAI